MLAGWNPEMRIPFSSCSLIACAVVALLASPLLTPLAYANDVVVPKAESKKVEAKKPEAKPLDEVPASAKAAAQAAASGAERRERQDPLDIVRARLAEKLGAGKFASSGGSSVIRVVSSPTVDAAPPAVKAAHTAKVASKQTATVQAVTAEAHSHALAPHWDYLGEGGPQAWAQLKNEFAICGNGKRQSPIDIRDGIKVQLDAVQFDYRATKFRVLDNGHTVQVNVSPGNFIEVTGPHSPAPCGRCQARGIWWRGSQTALRPAAL